MSKYSDYGFKNEAGEHSHAYLKPILLKLLGSPSKRILDVGCGNGAIAKYLLEQGYDIYGTDASKSGIAIAKQFYPDRFELQDVANQELPVKFSDKTFHTIIATEVIEHLYNPREFISFCKRVLHKTTGGELILSTPYHGYIKNLLISLTNKWDYHANPLWDGGHIKLWSKNTLTELLTEQGFQITDVVGCGRIPYLWKSIMIKGKLS